jgi:quercetin dioxygenase-like cupin family protein
MNVGPDSPFPPETQEHARPDRRFVARMLAMCALPSGAALAAAPEGGLKEGGVTVQKAGAQPPSTGAPANFTGEVRVEGRFQATLPARVSGGTVSFAPGARTAWHTHPLGQTLIVTAGEGLVQHWGGSAQAIRPGDVVWIPPGVKHWHGATPISAMTHVAISEALDGKTVDWLEHVTEKQYRG